MMKKWWLAGILSLSIFLACSKGNSNNNNEPEPEPPAPGVNEVNYWLTRGDQSVLLQKQSTILSFGTTANTNPGITIDPAQTFQTVDGFGYTLTSGSATLINGLPAATKSALLQELFGTGETAISINYLRISIGASDMSASVYSYNDLPAGQTDTDLSEFTLAPDNTAGTGLIPLLKEILLINPGIKILATPWSPPLWMKSNGNSVGGSLLPQYYPVYAQYFVKYIQAMKAEGITIDAITPQNEPLHPENNPSLSMTAAEQAEFIKTDLGPAFAAASLTTKIIIYDHNVDRTDYPIAVMNDPAAKQYIDGSAFHLYAGDISKMGEVRSAHPDKNLYFTEQYTGSGGSFEGDLKWHLRNVIIGSMRQYSRTALEWNLANDGIYGPHTDGGCTTCKGALTIAGGVQRNVAYYIIAHASKFVPAGSTRIYSSNSGNLISIAFRTPAGKTVLIVLNDAAPAVTFNIKMNDKWTTPTLTGNSVATFEF